MGESKTIIFTVEEANRTLPLVRNIDKDIITYSTKLSQFTETLDDIENNPTVEALISQIKEFINELSEIGCQYKGIFNGCGLVDFPSLMNGEPIMLCWKSDEPEIQYYHTEEEGFNGRKIIGGLLQKGEN